MASLLRVSLLSYLIFAYQGDAKEIVATYEWQEVGPNDTLPAGLEIRMDLGVGGKWARLPPKEIDSPNPITSLTQRKPRCGPSCKERQRERAEKRRTAGFLLREPHQKHRRGEEHEEHNFSTANASIYHVAGIFLVGLGLGLGAAKGVRRGKTGSLHES